MGGRVRKLRRRVELSRALYGMGADQRSSLALLTSYNSQGIWRRLGLGPVLPVDAQVRVGDRQAQVKVRQPSEHMALYEVMHQRHYACELERPPRTILDLGANAGFAAIYFHLRYPDAEIHTVEADPVTYEALLRNVEGIAAIHPYHLAVTDRDGTVTFHRDPSQPLSSSLARRFGHQIEVEVEGVALSTLLDRIGVDHVDLLKFDIEGAEWPVFAGFDGWDRIGTLLGELHVELLPDTPEAFYRLFGSDVRVDVRQRSARRILVEIRPR